MAASGDSVSGTIITSCPLAIDSDHFPVLAKLKLKRSVSNKHFVPKLTCKKSTENKTGNVSTCYFVSMNCLCIRK